MSAEGNILSTKNCIKNIDIYIKYCDCLIPPFNPLWCVTFDFIYFNRKSKENQKTCHIWYSVIFHLQKTERLSTRIGVQKLLEGALKVNAGEVFKLLETSEPDAKELAQEVKTILK